MNVELEQLQTTGGRGDSSRLLKKHLFSNFLVVLHTKFKHTTTIYSSNQIVFFKNPTF